VLLVEPPVALVVLLVEPPVPTVLLPPAPESSPSQAGVHITAKHASAQLMRLEPRRKASFTSR
jgi:hypothetical protein